MTVTVIVSLAVSLIALLGVLISQFVTSGIARKQREISRREELLRNVRWAAELAAEDNTRRSMIGAQTLVQLQSMFEVHTDEGELIAGILFGLADIQPGYSGDTQFEYIDSDPFDDDQGAET